MWREPFEADFRAMHQHPEKPRFNQGCGIDQRITSRTG
jgi:hypothetical protein